MISMQLNPNDQKVIDLLSKLKVSNGAYPSEIYAARRQAYLKQVASVGLGIGGVGAGLKNAAKSGNGATGTVATVTSKILETALIAAIAIEAGTAAYLYRDKIAELVRTYTGSSTVQEVVPPTGAGSSSNSELVGNTEAPVVTVITSSGTVIVTSGTPSPEVAAGNNNGETTNLNATPGPSDKNGNQYGLTPKPVRTKDNNDGGGGKNTNGDGNNKKP